MSTLWEETDEDYLELVKDWTDPYPTPQLIEHDGVLVVRDDMLNAGSKVRFIDYLIESNSEINEWVFGSCPATGYAQISLPIVCKRHNKKAVLFMAKRDEKNLTEYQ